MNTNDTPIKQIIDSALSKIGEVVDVNTVIGEPIVTGDVTVIPFSRVSVGFASGGSDFGGKSLPEGAKPYFAGGNGAGISMTPLGFIVIEKGSARVIELGNAATYSAPVDPVNRALDGINGVIDKAPELINKIADLIATYKPVKADDDPIDDDAVLDIDADTANINIEE